MFLIRNYGRCRRRLGEPKLLPQEEVTYAEPVLIPPNKVIHGSPKATLRHAPMPPMGFTQFQPNSAQDSYYSQQQNIRDHFGTLRSQREHKVNNRIVAFVITARSLCFIYIRFPFIIHSRFDCFSSIKQRRLCSQNSISLFISINV